MRNFLFENNPKSINMTNTNNRSSHPTGPSRPRSIPPLLPTPLTNGPGGNAQPSSANTAPHQPPQWRTLYRLNTPYPRYLSAIIPSPEFDTPGTDTVEHSGRTEGTSSDRDSDSDSDSDSETSQSMNDREGTMRGSPGWNRLAIGREDGLVDGNGLGPAIDIPDRLRRVAVSNAPSQNSQPDDVHEYDDFETPDQPGHSGHKTFNEVDLFSSQEISPVNNDHRPSHDSSMSGLSSFEHDAPSLQREQSRLTSRSMSTNVRTPPHPPTTLPDGMPMSLAQQVWQHRKIRKRIISHMDKHTAATLCRVNKRMYTQAIPVVVRTMESSTLHEITDIVLKSGAEVCLFLMADSQRIER
jgi:hypothetical protein